VLDREVDLTAQKTSATPEQANDVKGELGRILFGGALHDFAGRATLKSYISVIATRELVKTVQRGPWCLRRVVFGDVYVKLCGGKMFLTMKRAARVLAVVTAMLLPVALPTWAGPASTAEFKVPVEYYKLPNGLRVVLSQDHTAPTVCVAVYYRIGFRVEPRAG